MRLKKQTTVVVNGNKGYNLRRKLVIAIVMVIIACLLFRYTMLIKISNENFAKQASDFYRLNSQTIFSIDKIYMYSSAGAIENKESRPVWNLNLYQFTDIALYINNRSDDKFNYENSIKSLYIDNIKFTNVKNGEPSLYYKNINDFGKSIYNKAIDDSSTPAETQEPNGEQSQENTQEVNIYEQRKKIIEEKQKEKITEKLEFSILNDGDVDYSKPQLYTDCSNPITLEYINNNIKENEIISDIKNDVVFDGNILRKSGVILSDIACTMSFNIIIINNYNQRFIANVYIDIPLEDTTTGDNIYSGKFVKKIENTNFIRFFRLE